jgi:hypothetical protein
MAIQSYPNGLGGQPDVIMTNLQDAQRLSWDATTGKWINGKEYIPAPSITSPASNATVSAGVSLTVTCSAFVSPGSVNLTWNNNDWELATDLDFVNTINTNYNSTASATSWTFTPSLGYSSAFIRVRQNTVAVKGVWSAPVRVVLAQVLFFNTSSNWQAPANTNSVTPYLVGGGSGAAALSIQGGGGGAVTQPGSVSVTPNTTYPITVGAGATGTTSGGTSTFSTTNAVGGVGNATGNAGKASGNGQAGGTGGNVVGGGGGGAGGVGGAVSGTGVNSGSSAAVGGNGGAGAVVTIDGVTRGGGGGGGCGLSNQNWSFNGGTGGTGGGGNGANANGNGSAANGNNGTNGTGGGAGGSISSNWSGGTAATMTGGNGIVILYYTF